MEKDLIKFINTPLNIGNKVIRNRLVLSPMAGLTHIVLRKVICGFCPPGLLYTEMCLASMIPSENREKSYIFRWDKEEKQDLVCQILGNDPHIMVKAAERVQKEGLFGVDINMGCAVSRINKKGFGAALLNDPKKAYKIVYTIKKKINIPIIVKFRIGWRDDIEFVEEFAKSMEDRGADALIFHPRVALDKRNRLPKWEYISHVKKAVNIPVIGNGNIFCIKDLRQVLDTGCDGVALGRVAAARPWIFSQFLEDFHPNHEIYQRVPKDMLDGIFRYFDTNRALVLYKKWVTYFFSNFFYAHSLLKKIMRAKSKKEISFILNQILTPLPRLNNIPNLNFLK